MAKVRAATHDDIDMLLDLGELAQEESPMYSRYTPDYARQYRVLKLLIDTPQEACVLVVDDGSGMFIGHVEPQLWFVESVAVEDMFYIRKDVRGTSRAYKLLQGYLEWVATFGHKIKDIRAEITSEIDPESVKSLYEKMGFQSAGYLMRKENVNV